MAKATSHHQPKSKRPLSYDSNGMGFAEMMEIAEDHPFWFRVVLVMLFFNMPEKYILKLMREVI